MAAHTLAAPAGIVPPAWLQKVRLAMIRLSRGEAASIVGRRGLASLAGGLLVLVAVAASSAWQAERNADALARSSATQALRTLVAGILISAQDAETGQRGYLLTENPDYLAPFREAKARLPLQVGRLDQALPGDERIGALRLAISAKLAELQQTIDLVGAGRRDGALALVNTNAGRKAMADIRDAIDVIAQGLDAQLQIEADGIRSGGRLLVLIDVASLMLVIALVSLVALGVRAYLENLRAARQAASNAYRALERNREELDETVRFRTADLTAANQEIQRFAYIVSHDLRAPLVNIMGFTSELVQATGVLVGHVDNAALPASVRAAALEDIPEAIGFIKASTSKMDRLINAILQLSREGRRVLRPERLDMRELLDGVAATMRHQALAVEVSVGAVPGIVADRVAVEQVFGNIIDNALKYLQPGRPGRIGVTGCIEGAIARYDVADNGRGIAERDYERVFELFRRAGSQTVPGEGIGLASVRALVRRMGGSIECASILGAGTTFIVRLPLVGQYNSEAPP